MLYAAYGSNLHPVRVQQRTPTAQLLGTGAIANMALRFHKRGYRDFSGKCNIVWGQGYTVHVAIYEIPTAEMRSLDQHEGVGSGYDRALIHVDGFGKCVTYMASATHTDEALSPFTWYKALVLVGCEKLAFPSRYIETIRAVPAVRDFDCDRHEHHMNLVKKCRFK
ncbi:MAG: gamma-glutamylcyclotransferase family protein [Phormidesmis sp.]